MTTTLSNSPRQLMAQHLTALSAYAKRVLVKGEMLAPYEDTDKRRRFQEYLAIGTAFGCTKRELVGQLYSGVLVTSRQVV